MSRWDASSAAPPAPVSALDPRSELVSVALSASVTAAVESSGQVVRWAAEAGAGKHLPGLNGINIVDIAVSASKKSIRRFVITEKAPTRAFSWLKAATTAFTLRHY